MGGSRETADEEAAERGSSGYDSLLERARSLAAEKRARGELLEGTSEALDRLFLEVAPPGARAAGEGIEALVEMLARYSLEPTVPVESSRPGVGRAIRLVKLALRPIAAWQMRYLVDQLNAYHAAQIEVLRSLVREAREGEAGRHAGD